MNFVGSRSNIARKLERGLLLTALTASLFLGFQTDFKTSSKTTHSIESHKHHNCSRCMALRSQRLLNLARLSDKIFVIERTPKSFTLIANLLGAQSANDDDFQSILSSANILGLTEGRHLIFLHQSQRHQSQRQWAVHAQFSIPVLDSYSNIARLLDLLRQPAANEQNQVVAQNQQFVAVLQELPASKLFFAVINEINANDSRIAQLNSEQLKTLRTKFLNLPATSKSIADVAAILLRRSDDSENVEAVFSVLRAVPDDRLVTEMARFLRLIPASTYIGHLKSLLSSEEQCFKASFILARLDSEESRTELKKLVKSPNEELRAAALIGLAGEEEAELEAFAMDRARLMIRDSVEYGESELAQLLSERVLETRRFGFLRGQKLVDQAALFYIAHSNKSRLRSWLKSRSRRFADVGLKAFAQFHLTNSWANFDSAW